MFYFSTAIRVQARTQFDWHTRPIDNRERYYWHSVTRDEEALMTFRYIYIMVTTYSNNVEKALSTGTFKVYTNLCARAVKLSKA
jgi:hypothetical protein